MHKTATEMHKSVIDNNAFSSYNILGDDMRNDLTIKEIVNVYSQRKKGWSRDLYAPRYYDAVSFFVDGEIEYTFPRGKLTAKKGDILFLPGNLPYSGVRHTDEVAFIVLDFKCSRDDEFEEFGSPLIIKNQKYETLLPSFENALDIWEKQSAQSSVLIKSFLYSIIAHAFEEGKNGGSSFDEILSYVAANATDPSLSVLMLCEKFFISESQLRRNFHKNTGLSPIDYIQTLRINKAKNELSNTEKEIKQIASECGFASPYYFSRCFSKYVGMSPSKYRTLTLI